MKANRIFTLFLLLTLINCGNGGQNDGSSDDTGNQEVQANSCDEQTARVIGKLYYISNPIYMVNKYAALESFVNNYGSELSANSPIIKCMYKAGMRMQNAALQNFDAQAGNRAYETAINMNAPIEMANQVKSSIDNDQVQPYITGIELVWLSQVLPKAAQGDWSDFNNTGSVFRKQQIEGISIAFAMLQSMGESDAISYLMSSMTYYQPYVEYQTAVLVSWFFNE